MQFTAKYRLKKPEGPDTYNVNDFNANMDTIEDALAGLERYIDEEGLTPDRVVTAIHTAVAQGKKVNVNHLEDKRAKDFATQAQGKKADEALPRAGGTMSGPIDMGLFRLSNVADPSDAKDASNKAYVDGLIKAVNVSVTSNDSSQFPPKEWLRNHWAEIEQGVRSLRITHESDGSESLIVVAKRNAANGAALQINNKIGAQSIRLDNGTWDFAPFARAHVDHLNSDDTKATLSAKQGKVLDGKHRVTAEKIGLMSALKTAVKDSLVNVLNFLHDRLTGAESSIASHEAALTRLDQELKKKLAKWQAANASVIDGVVAISVPITYGGWQNDGTMGSRPQFKTSFDVPKKTNYTIAQVLAGYHGSYSQSASIKHVSGTRYELTLTEAEVTTHATRPEAMQVFAVYRYDKPAI